jgi:hypothetical protein
MELMRTPTRKNAAKTMAAARAKVVDAIMPEEEDCAGKASPRPGVEEPRENKRQEKHD